jgi:hypothetical protein
LFRPAATILEVCVSDRKVKVENATYVKAPMRKTLNRIALFFFGRRTLKRRGSGILNMITSDDILNTALVMRWFVAAEHCSILVSQSY